LFSETGCFSRQWQRLPRANNPSRKACPYASSFFSGPAGHNRRCTGLGFDPFVLTNRSAPVVLVLFVYEFFFFFFCARHSRCFLRFMDPPVHFDPFVLTNRSAPVVLVLLSTNFSFFLLCATFFKNERKKRKKSLKNQYCVVDSKNG
jgi:hypothetical protein